jgi:hypothetical protein
MAREKQGGRIVPDNSKSSKQARRQERLAAELRANLRKRKAQARIRQQNEPADSGGEATPSAADLRAGNPSVKS